METYFDANRYWRITRTVIVLFLLGIMALAPLGTTAQTTGVAPTSDAIVVDSYDCDTGRLEFRYIPESDGPLGYAIYADYEEGPRFTGLPSWSVQPSAADRALHRRRILGRHALAIARIFGKR